MNAGVGHRGFPVEEMLFSFSRLVKPWPFNPFS